MSTPKEINVTIIPPPQKHATIFQAFEDLEVGESFIIFNDHDPRPLRYQFENMHPDSFEWNYLEQGPRDWRVEIKRTK